MLDLLLDSPLALFLIAVTLVLHVGAFLWVRAKIRAAKLEEKPSTE
ncbi:MAG: hypothetical protein KDB61_12335 [Planctomycetes bacterium]|nr:hypothetical protein [Planctomycetota bacterium]